MEDYFDMLQSLKDNKSDITSCDFGGNYMLAIGSSDKTVRILEWKKGLGFVDVSFSPLHYHKYGVTWVRFSPQGTMLASSSLDGTTVLWNVKTGIQIYTMVQPTKCSVRRCEFTPDSTKLVTAGDDGVFCFWDLAHRTHISRHDLHNEEDSCTQGLAISPDSEYLLTGDNTGLMRLWCLSEIRENHLQVIHASKNIHDGINCCEFSSDFEISDVDNSNNKYYFATCGADSLINLWSISVKRNMKQSPSTAYVKCDVSLIRTMAGHENDVLCIRFNLTGTLIASAGLDKTVRLWQVDDGECIKQFHGHTRFVNCCAFSKSTALLASGSNDRSLIIWDLNQNFSLDSELMKRCKTFSHFNGNESCGSLLLAEELLIRQSESEMKLLELTQTLNLTSGVNTVHFHGNNVLAAAGGDKTVTVWRRKSERESFTIESVHDGHKYSVNQVEISPCGSKLVSCSMDGSMIISDLEIGLTYEMRCPECVNGIRTNRFSPNSELIAAAGDDQKVFLWDAKSLEFIKTLQEHKDSITSVAFSHDCKLLASTCSAGDLKIYDLEADILYATEDGIHDLGATCCDFSISVSTAENQSRPSEEYTLATCGNDSLIKVFKIRLNSVIKEKELASHGGNVTCVRFSPKLANVLASCATDYTCKLWNTESGECLHVFHIHGSIVTTCAFSQDSSLLASGSLDKTVLLWTLPTEYNMNARVSIEKSKKLLQHWSTSEIVEWLNELGFSESAEKVKRTTLNGQQLTSWKINEILDAIGVDNEEEKNSLRLHLYWLRSEAKKNYSYSRQQGDAPHQFLCPITHEIMTDPVICSDGFTYERGAIIEWLLCGRYTSPMTNEPLRHLKFLPNTTLKTNILKYLYGVDVKD
ncbi:UNVERIFIED_CONTAM: hypothetical protein PYX00_001136 [Menopon gallinae]|uniref:WD repeat, SAM and U-box domain-containing protein 1 n=1 Tax=Menopon gallinae TaxID=328185 RepID=A0AAW2IBE8_9NEOP